jgi:hypothetical protein
MEQDRLETLISFTLKLYFMMSSWRKLNYSSRRTRLTPTKPSTKNATNVASSKLSNAIKGKQNHTGESDM